jgi:hypothetical protein
MKGTLMLFKVGDLFKNTEVNESAQNIISKATRKPASRYFHQFGKRLHKVQDVIGDIRMGDNIHFVSAGEWSSHELLFHLLNQTGPADVYIATWSFTETAARMILDQIEKKRIKNIYIIMDWRVKVRTPQVLDMLNFNISTIRLTQCHAKATAILNKRWGVAVVGSANYTNNPRIESGVISCNRDLAKFHIGWMSDCVNRLNPFEFGKNETK